MHTVGTEHRMISSRNNSIRFYSMYDKVHALVTYNETFFVSLTVNIVTSSCKPIRNMMERAFAAGWMDTNEC